MQKEILLQLFLGPAINVLDYKSIKTAELTATTDIPKTNCEHVGAIVSLRWHCAWFSQTNSTKYIREQQMEWTASGLPRIVGTAAVYVSVISRTAVSRFTVTYTRRLPTSVVVLQEAQLSQRNRAMLPVIKYFAQSRSLKVIWNDTLQYGVCKHVSRTVSETFSVK